MKKFKKLGFIFAALFAVSLLVFGALGIGFAAGVAILAIAPLAMTEEQMKALQEKLKSEFETFFKGKSLTTEQIDEKIKALDIENKLKTLDKTADIEKLKTDLISMAEKVEKFKTINIGGKSSWKRDVEESIKEKADKIAEAAQSSGRVDIYKMKTDNTPELDTTIVGAQTPSNPLMDLNATTQAANIRLRTFDIQNYVTIGTSDIPYMAYSDVIPVHDPSDKGFPTVVAEGELKPRVAFTIENRNASEEIIAAYEVLTKQAYRNVKGMQSLSTEYLMRRVMLKRAQHILGKAKTIGDTFDPTSWTGAAVPDANLYDVVLAAMNQIANTESWTDDIQYFPNVAFVNWADYMELNVLKDGESNYLQKLNQLCPIVPLNKNDIPAGKILIGDFTLLQAFVTFPYQVATGWVNDNFIRNKYCLLGETGLISFVKEYDERAFLYDDIATIKSAISGS